MSTRRSAFALAVFSACAPGMGAMAEEESRQIEEVTVTAERREASVQDTSISITAFTEEMLGDYGIRNQEDLQNFIPATTIQPYDATVRGVGRNFRALGGDPGVATYYNGVFSPDFGIAASENALYDIQRIEVLRGPQGTLFGKNTTGGAVNITTKKPVLGEFFGKVQASYGQFASNDSEVTKATWSEFRTRTITSTSSLACTLIGFPCLYHEPTNGIRLHHSSEH